MKKKTTINVRVDAQTKENAEKVLSELGISMTSAINMYLCQIIQTKGLPFQVALSSSDNKK